MLDAGADIIEATSGLGLKQFAGDKLRYKAVIRDLEVLGEAAARLPEAVRALAREEPWRDIVAMRNKLIHGYLGVDLAIVHHAALIGIPELLPRLRALPTRVRSSPES